MALTKIVTNLITDDAITAAKIADGTIVAADLAANSVDSSELVNGSVDLAHMSVNSIDSDQYVDGSIDTAHIANDQITAALMADNSIDSDMYVDGSIDTAHINDLNVTTAKIAADAITGAKLADNAVDSEHYTDGSIDTAHIANLQITTALIAADAIDGTKLADNAVDSEHYTDGSIDTAHIANDQITAALMADNSIDSDMYVDGSIDTAHIANDQITAALIADNAIDSDMYVDGSIDLAHMSSESVDEDNLYISNSGSNGQYLQKQSGNNGGLTWASVSSPISALNSATANELVTVGSTTTELDAEATLTFDANVLTMVRGDDGRSILRFNANRGAAGDALGDIEWQWNGNVVASIRPAAGADTTNKDDAHIDFYTTTSGGSNTRRMRLTDEGKLGIGETGPLGIFHSFQADSGTSSVNNPDGYQGVFENSANSGITILSGTGNNGHVLFGDSGDNDIGRIVYRHNGNTMAFDCSAVERMRLLSGGDLAFGQTAVMSGTVRGGVSLHKLGRCNISYEGTAGHASMTFYNTNGEIGSISHSGTTTSFNTSSDYRLKENETTISDGISRIKQLKPYRFNFKTDSGKTLDGFFAHEVSGIVPEAVTGDKDAMNPEVLYTEENDPGDALPEGKNYGDVKEAISIKPQKIDQSKLVPLLVAAVKELTAKVEALENA